MNPVSPAVGLRRPWQGVALAGLLLIMAGCGAASAHPVAGATAGVAGAHSTGAPSAVVSGAVGRGSSAPGPGRTGVPDPGMAAAPYVYLGGDGPPDPSAIMSATGVRWFTMAFVLTHGSCAPQWDGVRPLTGGVDQRVIDAVRAAGGDVMVSFGGSSGPWLEQSCGSARTLAAAYQQVITAYRLKAIDIDIEGAIYHNPGLQQRTIDALRIVEADNPAMAVYVTFPMDAGGPDAGMINRAAGAGLSVDGWAVMPFDVDAAGQDMGALAVRAVDQLAGLLAAAYRYSGDEAYRHAGISTINGSTDSHEIVTPANFRTMLGYAQQHHLARFTFWATNRDRPCTPGTSSANDTCSGVAQAAWDFTRIVAQYHG
jgi:hypothetical protein